MTLSRTILINKQGMPHESSATRTTDARTAITRGLAEYLESLRVEAAGGRVCKFKKVFQTWAEPEDEANYPSAIVYSNTPAIYDSSRFTPGVAHTDKLPAPDGRYIVSIAEMTMALTLELWCTDPHERMILCDACESALVPTDYMYGLVLELPHYYNQRAVYELQSVNYVDSEDDAIRRYRRAVLEISAQLPIIQLKSIPSALPRVSVSVDTFETVITDIITA